MATAVSGETVHEYTASNEMVLTGPNRARKGVLTSPSERTSVTASFDKLGQGIVQVWRDGRLMHTHAFAREDNVEL